MRVHYPKLRTQYSPYYLPFLLLPKDQTFIFYSIVDVQKQAGTSTQDPVYFCMKHFGTRVLSVTYVEEMYVLLRGYSSHTPQWSIKGHVFFTI